MVWQLANNVARQMEKERQKVFMEEFGKDFAAAEK
jgi:predicted component of type VI protein secretion system